MSSNRQFIEHLQDGRETLHDRAKLTPECEANDVVGAKVVDEWTAEALLLRGDAVACPHCIGGAWG